MYWFVQYRCLEWGEIDSRQVVAPEGIISLGWSCWFVDVVNPTFRYTAYPKCLVDGVWCIIGLPGSYHYYLGMDQYLLIPFLVGWTSIYQLFWGSPWFSGPQIPRKISGDFSRWRCFFRPADHPSTGRWPDPDMLEALKISLFRNRAMKPMTCHEQMLSDSYWIHSWYWMLDDVGVTNGYHVQKWLLTGNQTWCAGKSTIELDHFEHAQIF